MTLDQIYKRVVEVYGERYPVGNFARELHKNENFLHDVLMGMSQVGSDDLLKISNLLSVSVSELKIIAFPSLREVIDSAMIEARKEKHESTVS